MANKTNIKVKQKTKQNQMKNEKQKATNFIVHTISTISKHFLRNSPTWITLSRTERTILWMA